MGIDHNKRLKEHLYYYSARISRDISNLIKWLVLAVVTGCIVGAASTLFSFTLKAVTSYRKAHEWIFLLLPLSGLVIVFLYEKLGKEDGGTNQVLSTVRSRDDVPILSAPLIFITTALTHLTGGSAGRLVAQQAGKVRRSSLEEVLPTSLEDGSIWTRRTVM